jgi:hypothetical protein
MADEKKPTAKATKAEEPAEEYPDTPSGKALAEVGNLDGEDVEADGYEAANKHGEAYQAAKRKHRWG